MKVELTNEQIERIKFELGKEFETNSISKHAKNLCKTCRKSKICAPHNRYGLIAMRCDCHIRRIKALVGKKILPLFKKIAKDGWDEYLKKYQEVLNEKP